mmetsp:Transcript_36703/g.80319  ORF Transcript_36703/g.80319 Transcript_36703/m.80319 type:complete len:221 (+) Transcript_36703:207-869(+)
MMPSPTTTTTTRAKKRVAKMIVTTTTTTTKSRLKMTMTMTKKTTMKKTKIVNPTPPPSYPTIRATTISTRTTRPASPPTPVATAASTIRPPWPNASRPASGYATVPAPSAVDLTSSIISSGAVPTRSSSIPKVLSAIPSSSATIAPARMPSFWVSSPPAVRALSYCSAGSASKPSPRSRIWIGSWRSGILWFRIASFCPGLSRSQRTSSSFVLGKYHRLK